MGLAAGSQAVCVFINDRVYNTIVEKLVSLDVRLIAPRAAWQHRRIRRPACICPVPLYRLAPTENSNQFAQTRMKTSIIIAFWVLTSFLNNSYTFGTERAKTAPRSPATQPFTYANVVSSFKQAHLRATEVQPRCTIFFEGEWKNANIYNYCVIMVENSDQDIQVTFYLTDAHEMNWITEFLDAPFFARDETQKLFGLINSNHDVRGQKWDAFASIFIIGSRSTPKSLCSALRRYESLDTALRGDYAARGNVRHRLPVDRSEL